VPVIAVNGLDRLERGREVLREKHATLVAVGHGLIAGSDWPNKVREASLEEIVLCTGCDECFDDLRNQVSVGCSP
jgi:2,4-dienoyl-CoA reductase-like NADH-dependent reductase (Old Yellow Enzyme family)